MYSHLLVFVYGLIFGSFYNVVALRGLEGKSLLKPSHCNKCGVRLKAINLIPVLSYIIQKGKCHKCHEKIDLIYPIFEFLTGLSFALIYQTYGLSIEFFIQVILISALIISTITDIKEMIVLDSVVIISCIAIFLLRILNKELLGMYLISSLVYFIVFFIINQFELIGGGDVKLIAVIALSVGWYNTLIVLLISSVTAIAYYFIKRQKQFKYVPFLLVGTIITTIIF